LVPFPAVVGGAMYGVAWLPLLECLYRLIPAEHRPYRRVFREPASSIGAMAAFGASIAWYTDRDR
jgi:hypothetical protein